MLFKLEITGNSPEELTALLTGLGAPAAPAAAPAKKAATIVKGLAATADLPTVDAAKAALNGDEPAAAAPAAAAPAAAAPAAAAPAAAAAATTAPAAAGTVDLEQVRERIIALSQAGKKDAIKAAFAKFGAKKAVELAPHQYAPFIEELKAA